MQKVSLLRMLPLGIKHRWMFIAILFYGIFVKNSEGCESSGTNETYRQKNVLFVSAKGVTGFPSEVVYHEVNGMRLCFGVQGNETHADCCHEEGFNCDFKIKHSGNNYSLILNKETLSMQDIVLINVPDDNFKCMPSTLYNKGFYLNIHRCLNLGTKNIKLSQNDFCGKSPSYDEDACKGVADTYYNVTVFAQKSHCVSCKPPEEKPDDSITRPTPESNNGTGISPENAANIMNNMSLWLDQMGNRTTASIIIGNIKGVIIKLPPKKQTNIIVGIKTSGDVDILKDNNVSKPGFSRLVHIPREASAMAIKRNGSFAAVLRFPEMQQDDPKSFLLNDEAMGIEMGTEISNLSHSIDIHYRHVDKNGNIASCRSWDGKGKKATWITDGCKTEMNNDSIMCQCSHLTFFAILMSPPPGNISSSDFTSLTYITSIGCGLSMFFLLVALFMHCLIRKGKATQATKILMNLFVAMLTLNLSFLVNESIAELGNFGACVAVAAVTHYTMLATFSWFFIQALHLYLHLWKLSTDIKHYMIKICIAGWVTPAAVVIALVASRQYDYMIIYTDDGNSEKMCWISDALVHLGVNVGYYAVVFIFTFVIFILTVRQIVRLKPAAGKDQDSDSIKTNTFSILGLFLMFGITWAFAFFSHGPMVIASYYVFTILNSFQGFFLFIYYCNSRKTVEENRSSTAIISSTATTDTVVTNPY